MRRDGDFLRPPPSTLAANNAPRLALLGNEKPGLYALPRWINLSQQRRVNLAQQQRIYKIMESSYARGRLDALNNSAMTFQVVGELGQIAAPLVDRVLKSGPTHRP